MLHGFQIEVSEPFPDPKLDFPYSGKVTCLMQVAAPDIARTCERGAGLSVPYLSAVYDQQGARQSLLLGPLRHQINVI